VSKRERKTRVWSFWPQKSWLGEAVYIARKKSWWAVWFMDWKWEREPWFLLAYWMREKKKRRKYEWGSLVDIAWVAVFFTLLFFFFLVSHAPTFFASSCGARCTSPHISFSLPRCTSHRQHSLLFLIYDNASNIKKYLSLSHVSLLLYNNVYLLWDMTRFVFRLYLSLIHHRFMLFSFIICKTWFHIMLLTKTKKKNNLNIILILYI
jgi:hypothetical protein